MTLAFRPSTTWCNGPDMCRGHRASRTCRQAANAHRKGAHVTRAGRARRGIDGDRGAGTHSRRKDAPPSLTRTALE
eukprot:759397-Prymnesium_polylepis.1